jgi:hypothetical protein
MSGDDKRDEEETMQISLRLPGSWMTRLRRSAALASMSEDRTISPQEVVRRILRRALEQDDVA